jgi:hypothetical protein
MRSIETLTGEGEVSYTHGALVGRCQYRVEVSENEMPGGHLRAGQDGGVHGLRQTEIRDITCDAPIPTRASLVLTLQDGRTLLFMMRSVGVYEAMGGIREL